MTKTEEILLYGKDYSCLPLRAPVRKNNQTFAKFFSITGIIIWLILLVGVSIWTFNIVPYFLDNSTDEVFRKVQDAFSPKMWDRIMALDFAIKQNGEIVGALSCLLFIFSLGILPFSRAKKFIYVV